MLLTSNLAKKMDSTLKALSSSTSWTSNQLKLLFAKTLDLVFYFRTSSSPCSSPRPWTWSSTSEPALHPVLRQDPGPGLLLQNQLSGPLFTKTLAPGLLLQNLPSGLLLAKTLDLVHFSLPPGRVCYCVE